MGVPLNEAADDAARQAAQSNAEPIQLSVPYKDLYTAIKSSVKSSWQEEWSNTHCNKLRSIKDSIVASPESADHNRKSSIIITRLCIGHTRLTHQHLMERRPAPHCPFCANDTFTVEHLLAVCPQLTVSRQRWLSYCTPTTTVEVIMKKILTNNYKIFEITSIIGFLREHRLLSKI